MRNPNENTVTGQNRVIRKKGDLTGVGKGDWLRVNLMDEQYKKNYDKIFRKEKKVNSTSLSTSNGSYKLLQQQQLLSTPSGRLKVEYRR